MLSFGNIAVPAQYPCLGERFSNLLFHLLSADTQKFDPPALTVRTYLWGFSPIITMVADQVVLVSMIGQRDVAAPAAQHEAAIAALDEGCCSSAVEEQDNLLPRVQGIGNAFSQRTAEDAPVPLFQLTAQVYDLDLRERRWLSRAYPLGELEQPELALLHSIVVSDIGVALPRITTELVSSASLRATSRA